jgi:hypothetical protein
MKTRNLLYFACFCALLFTAQAVVFEAETSEDVDIFLDDFQDQTIGLLFYDSSKDNAEQQNWFSSLSSRILGIFMSRDQYGRSTEDWVEMFDDKLHLMRIDLTKGENIRAKNDFNINDDPYLVLMDQRRTVLREKVSDETYDHVKDLLDKRPNLLHKTGGAVLKSFNLEPDANATTSEPRVIQYFDLEEGEPINVEAPVETQYVNWAPVDVIGPEGKWIERGRNWVTSYEIPESGIKNQESNKLAKGVPKTSDDQRYNRYVPKYTNSQNGPVARAPVATTTATRPETEATPTTRNFKSTTKFNTGARPTGAPASATTTSASTSTTARRPYHSNQYQGYNYGYGYN